MADVSSDEFYLLTDEDAERLALYRVVPDVTPALDGDLPGLLDDVAAFLHRFVVLTPTQSVALALWVAHTHAIAAAAATPYIAITSPEKRSGKTLLLEVLGLLVRTPLPTANISDAALFRAIAQLEPTLLFDEVDAIFGAKARDREDMRGILCAGYRRSATVLRMGGPRMTTLEQFPVFCAKTMAGIGDCLPDTIADRSIPIRLQRRTRDELIERFRRREVEPATTALRTALAEALEPQLPLLHDARPQLPDELDDRAQDVWEPLLAIADLAGDDWSQQARAAALELSAGQAREDDSLTARLIADICSVFNDTDEDRLKTTDLIDQLCRIEENPWGDCRGRPITPQALSKLLRPYRIKTQSVWVQGETVRGYKREQFADAFHRVLGVRSDRSLRTGSSSDAAPNAPTTPNARDAVAASDNHARPNGTSPTTAKIEPSCAHDVRVRARAREAGLGELDDGGFLRGVAADYRADRLTLEQALAWEQLHRIVNAGRHTEASRPRA
jgi:hypothetical protein